MSYHVEYSRCTAAVALSGAVVIATLLDRSLSLYEILSIELVAILCTTRLREPRCHVPQTFGPHPAQGEYWCGTTVLPLGPP